MLFLSLKFIERLWLEVLHYDDISKLYIDMDLSPAMEGTSVISTVGSLRSHTTSVFKEQLGFVRLIFGELI